MYLVGTMSLVVSKWGTGWRNLPGPYFLEFLGGGGGGGGIFLKSGMLLKLSFRITLSFKLVFILFGFEFLFSFDIFLLI